MPYDPFATEVYNEAPRAGFISLKDMQVGEIIAGQLLEPPYAKMTNFAEGPNKLQWNVRLAIGQFDSEGGFHPTGAEQILSLTAGMEAQFKFLSRQGQGGVYIGDCLVVKRDQDDVNKDTGKRFNRYLFNRIAGPNYGNKRARVELGAQAAPTTNAEEQRATQAIKDGPRTATAESTEVINLDSMTDKDFF